MAEQGNHSRKPLTAHIAKPHYSMGTITALAATDASEHSNRYGTILGGNLGTGAPGLAHSHHSHFNHRKKVHSPSEGLF
eukprot:5770472-Heterocapsa_arctica.AAC.1